MSKAKKIKIGNVYFDVFDEEASNRLTDVENAEYVPTLNATPTSATVTYTKDEATINFVIGQFARVPNANSPSGYILYQLVDLSGDPIAASWKQVGSGDNISPVYDGTTRSLTFPAGSSAGYDSQTRTITF